MTVIQKFENIKLVLDITLSTIGLVALILFFWIFGFELTKQEAQIVKYSVLLITLFFIAQEFSRWFLHKNRKEYLKERLFENIIACFLLIDLMLPIIIVNFLLKNVPNLSFQQANLINLGIILFFVILAISIKALRYNHLISKLKLNPGAIFAISFALIILFGSFLLLLPNSTPAGKPISFIDALFTSTSAVCVTGLVVVDTAKDFTIIGKTVIMFLIQIGGLGVMTITTFFALYLSGGVSFRYKLMMNEILGPDNLGEVSSLLKRILLFTFSIEFVGAVIMYHSYGGSLFNLKLDLVYFSVFHAVSAFCNAGFSTHSLNLLDPLLVTNYIYLSTIMLLIILGGLGFTVLSNLTELRPFRNDFRRLRNRLSVASKIVILTTLLLIVSGTLLIFVFEPYNFDSSLTYGEKLFHSLFFSVTARTAGFNMAPMSAIAPVTILILLPLMWVGASPGSTGGGIKTTTFAIAILSLLNVMKGKERLEIYNKEISQDTIKKAFLIILSSTLFLGVGIIILVWAEPDKEPLHLIFEAVSAIGTVGLSIDLSNHLGTGGKAVIVSLMYIGRIGVLTFFTAFVRARIRTQKYSLPKTAIIVG